MQRLFPTEIGGHPLRNLSTVAGQHPYERTVDPGRHTANRLSCIRIEAIAARLCSSVPAKTEVSCCAEKASVWFPVQTIRRAENAPDREFRDLFRPLSACRSALRFSHLLPAPRRNTYQGQGDRIKVGIRMSRHAENARSGKCSPDDVFMDRKSTIQCGAARRVLGAGGAHCLAVAEGSDRSTMISETPWTSEWFRFTLSQVCDLMSPEDNRFTGSVCTRFGYLLDQMTARHIP